MSDQAEPIQDIAHLAHVEILTPDLAATVAFFTNIIGLHESHRSGDAVYLRAWGDYYHHTLKVTGSRQAGLGHAAWRAVSARALQRRVSAIERAGFGRGWIDGDAGHGAAYRFVDPAGHPMEIFYDVEWHRTPADERTRLRNQPQRYPLHGIGARRLDHVNLMAQDVVANRDFLIEHLGFRLREHIVHHGVENGAWLSVTPLVHDIAYMRDGSGADGRFHHVAYWLDSQGELIRAADILRDYGVHLEAGPAKHAITNALFIYLYEPGGNRVELFTGGYLIFPPDWQPVTWTAEDQDLRVWWGGDLPQSFFTYGTPPAPSPQIEKVPR